MESTKPDAANEVEWIKQAQQGDQQAFGRLVERYQRRVFSLAYHLVRRRDAVEDLAQEIFLKAYLAIQSFNFESSFGTWLGRVAVNHCYDYLRKERASRVKYFAEMSEETSRRLEESYEGEMGDAPNAEQQALLEEAVSSLLERAPADDRILLVLKEMEELSVQEIAEIMRLTKTAVKVRLHRARKRMLEDYNRWREGR
jgi:RNA polymerase sigma-70 factor (ECF subfamily)